MLRLGEAHYESEIQWRMLHGKIYDLFSDLIVSCDLGSCLLRLFVSSFDRCYSILW